MISRFLYVAGLLLLIVAFTESLRASPQVSSQVSAPLYSHGPVTDYNSAVPGTNDVLRLRRGQRYNTPNSPEPELGEQSDSVLVGEEMESFYQDPLPFNASDAVVVGKVTAGQAYLSDDRRDIYSEFKVSVGEALRVPSIRSVQAGDRIDVERYGGAIRLPSGKVLVRGAREFSMPLVGKRYLLFLKYNPSTEDFHIITGYQLEGDHTYRLDELDYAYADRHHSKLVHPLREQGEKEEEFLNRVRSTKSPNQGGK